MSEDEPKRAPLRVPGPEVLAARARLLGHLSAGMIHEARNPLNALAIHLEVLADKLRVDHAVPPHLDKNLQAARRQIRRLDEILRSFGDFAIESDVEEPKPLRELATHAQHLCEYHLRRAGSQFEQDHPDGLFAHGRPSLVTQALIELILFAADSLPGEAFRLSSRRVEGQVLIEVAGGVPPERPARGRLGRLESLAGELDGALAVSDGDAFGCSLSLPIQARPRGELPRLD